MNTTRLPEFTNTVHITILNEVHDFIQVNIVGVSLRKETDAH